MDLAHLLRRFGLAVEFLTVTLGANPAYEREHFYREHLREDCARVKRLFQALPGACTQASELGCLLFEYEPIHLAYLREGCARVTRLFQTDAAQGLHLSQRVWVFLADCEPTHQAYLREDRACVRRLFGCCPWLAAVPAALRSAEPAHAGPWLLSHLALVLVKAGKPVNRGLSRGRSDLRTARRRRLRTQAPHCGGAAYPCIVRVGGSHINCVCAGGARRRHRAAAAEPEPGGAAGAAFGWVHAGSRAGGQGAHGGGGLQGPLPS